MDQRTKRKIKQPLFGNFKLDEVDEIVYLWRNVLDQALDDYRFRHKLKPKFRKEIEEWVNVDNADFIKVCELANFDPKKVIKVFTRQAYEERINNAK